MSEGSISEDLIKAGSLSRSVVKGIARAAERVADRCRSKEFQLALGVLDNANRRGANIYLTGIGKSGLVARRGADAWASAGLHAHFLDPVNLLHGDLGRVRMHDLIVFISQSGTTTELHVAADQLQHTQHMAITGAMDNPLAQRCLTVLVSEIEMEVVPYQATAAQNAWIDALMAGWLAIHPEISFVANHPGGSIGQRHTT